MKLQYYSPRPTEIYSIDVRAALMASITGLTDPLPLKRIHIDWPPMDPRSQNMSAKYRMTYWSQKGNEDVIPKIIHIRYSLTHWGRVTHLCVGKLTIIGSDNGFIWTNAGILFIGPLGTNFNEILIGIQTLSFKKIHFKMSSAKWRPFVSASMC